MTISSTNRKAGPFIGNGSASVFAFSFRVFSASDLEVVRITVATGAETTLTINSGYTVTLNADQNSNPGGSITLVGGALASVYNLIITSNIANLQPTDLTNQGGFYPEVITDALDRATIQIQQLDEHVNRSLSYPITDPALGTELPAVAQRANRFLAFDANGEPVADLPASVAGWENYQSLAAASASSAASSASTATSQAATATSQATTATTQAGIATTQAGIATTQAGVATSARISAESARDAAFVNANVYASTAAGLAAVADGVQFQVVSGEIIIRYVRTNSTTATEVSRYPASSSLRRPNMVRDPYMREIAQNYRIVDGLRPAFLGTVVSPDSTSPVSRGSSIGATGTSQVRRYLALPDGIVVGDLATFSVLFSATALTEFVLTFRNSAFSAISSHTAPSLSGSFIEQLVSVTVPAGAVIVEFSLQSSVSSTKTLYGTFASLGVTQPSRADIWQATAPVLNKYPDHLFKVLARGVPAIDGYNLQGYNIPSSVENPPAESPFTTKCLRLPSGSASLDMKIAATRLGLSPGKNLHVTIGAVYSNVLSVTFDFFNASGVTVGSSVIGNIDCRDPATNARMYAEMRVALPITSTIASTATYLRARFFSQGASIAEAFIVGISIADQLHYLSDGQVEVDFVDAMSRAAVPSSTLGAKIGIFGDSIPGTGINIDDGNRYLQDYMNQAFSGNVVNFAIGGTTMAGRTDPAYDAFSMSALADAVNSGVWTTQDANIGSMVSPASVNYAALKATNWATMKGAVLMFGTNDYAAQSVAIGTNTDTTRATFKGALNNSIRKLLDKAPQLRLMVATPIWRDRLILSFTGTISISGTTMTVTGATTTDLAVGHTIQARGIDRRLTVTALGTGTGGNGTYTVDRSMTLGPVTGYGWNPATNGRTAVNAVGLTLADYAQAIRDIADYQNIPVIDLSKDLGWGPSNVAYWTADGVHPNIYGAISEMATVLSRRISLWM